MAQVKNKARFLSVVLGNIVMCATVVALFAVAFSGGKTARAGGDAPYYSGKSTTSVSLMINVYWGTEYIQPMLDILDRYNLKTTFFVGGSWAAGNENTLNAICASGHELGNHGYYHKDHAKIDEAHNRREISSAHDIVKDITGVEMTLFAPPSGAFDDTTLSVAAELGYRTVMWTRDTIDWRDHDPDLIYRRAVKNVKGGDLILMHPTDATVKALERIIIEISAQGLRVEPVGKVLDAPMPIA